MDVKYINPFLKAVENLFDTMIEVPFTLGKPSIKQDKEAPYEISGIIGLSGSVTGCVVISLSEAIAFHLVSALTGETVSAMDSDTTDAIGEIANMIAGNAKTDFPGEGNAISVPTVVIGKHEVSYPKGVPIISIPCETDKGRLIIEVAMKVVDEPATQTPSQ
jgi:chemotaxis protein CheX